MTPQEQKEQAASEAFGCFIFIIAALILIGAGIVWGFGWGCLMAAAFLSLLLVLHAIGLYSTRNIK